MSALYLSVCLYVCGQKVATLLDALHEALNHTAKSVLVLQLIAINRDFLGTIKRGNSLIIKRFFWLWATLPLLSLAKTLHLALLFVFSSIGTVWLYLVSSLVLIFELEKYNFAYVMESCWTGSENNRFL